MEPFKAQGVYRGVPYRMPDGVRVEALMSGAVVEFASFKAFTASMPRRTRPVFKVLGILLLLGGAFFGYAVMFGSPGDSQYWRDEYTKVARDVYGKPPNPARVWADGPGNRTLNFVMASTINRATAETMGAQLARRAGEVGFTDIVIASGSATWVYDIRTRTLVTRPASR